MRGINLKLPYSDSSFEKPSQKTDLLVEQTLSSFSTEHESNSIFDIKNSSNLLRSFSSIGREPSEQKISFETYKRLEEEVKGKNLIIKELQNSNNELKFLIKQLQDEK